MPEAIEGLCDTCSKVLPARTMSEYTVSRAERIVEHGLCICLPGEGGLGYLAPDTREIYLELQRELEATDPSIPIDEIGEAAAAIEANNENIVRVAMTMPPLIGKPPTTIDGVVVEPGPLHVLTPLEEDAQIGIYVIGSDGTDPHGIPAIGAGMPEELWGHTPVPARPPDAPPIDETKTLPRIGPRGVPEEPVFPVRRQQPTRKPRRKRKR
jgi:hypothetical protein